MRKKKNVIKKRRHLRFQGTGKLEWKDGEKCEGEWVEGKLVRMHAHLHPHPYPHEREREKQNP
jgi:hypothetical protein